MNKIVHKGTVALEEYHENISNATTATTNYTKIDTKAQPLKNPTHITNT